MTAHKVRAANDTFTSAPWKHVHPEVEPGPTAGAPPFYRTASSCGTRICTTTVALERILGDLFLYANASCPVCLGGSLCAIYTTPL